MSGAAAKTRLNVTASRETARERQCGQAPAAARERPNAAASRGAKARPCISAALHRAAMAAKMALEMDPAIIEFFDSLTGSGAVNLSVVTTKYEAMRRIARRYIGALADVGACGRFAAARRLAAAECTALAEQFHREFNDQLCAPETVPVKMYDNTEATKEYRTKYGELYRRSKQAPVLAALLTMTGNMLKLRGACEQGEPARLAEVLGQLAAEDDDNQPPELRVFAVGALEEASSAEVCLTALAGEDPEAAEAVWPIVQKLLALGLEFFSVLEQPDFDSDTIANAVTSALEGCSKTLPRCEAGFRLIRNSTGLFKQNASRYQREIEASGNPFDLFRYYCEDVSKYATEQLDAGKTDHERRRAIKTKADLCRIMSHVGQTTQKMQSAAGPTTAGGRLLRVLGRQIEQTQKSLVDEMLATEKPKGPSAVQKMADKIRKQQAEDAAAAEQAAAAMLAARGDAVLLLDGPPVTGRDGAAADPAKTRGGASGEAWNLNAALAYINGQPEKKHKKKKKTSAKAEAAEP